jgi:arylsulfatase A-like enzyme
MVRACYYAMIELIDHQFGRIIDAVEKTGQLDNTLIIFTADHGELLGDHGLIYKGCRFYEALVHVPLIIAWGSRIKRGMRSRGLVELVDLAPTVLDAAGLAVPDAMQGTSLMPLLKGASDPDVGKPHVTAEFYDAIDEPRGTHATMYFDGRYKSIVYHDVGVGELYDLEADPGEFDDLWDEPEHGKLRCELLHRHFDAVMATSGPGIPRTDSY